MSTRLPDWNNASCKDYSTDLFFPVSRDDWAANKKTIRAICNNCPLFNTCLDYALNVNVVGIWAGTDYAERRALRKLHGITAQTLSESM